MKNHTAFLVAGRKVVVLSFIAPVALVAFAGLEASAQVAPRDPGIRGGAPAAGGPLPGLSQYEADYFNLGKEDFEEAEGVGDGLGPRFNLDGCVGCHIQPASGGTSPPVNPQVAVATAFGARNLVPSFIAADGPILEARFRYGPDGARDGGVRSLFVISGRADSTGDAAACDIKQPDFEGELRHKNVALRIPTPVFGLGLVEAIPDSTILANSLADRAAKKALDISGRPNRNGSDSTISRFGWKAQNQTLLTFSAEAYNVEMGITNEMFQVERDEAAQCLYGTVPNDVQNMAAGTALEGITAIQNFANFMRFLAPPTPSLEAPGDAASIARGRAAFDRTGCAFCHTATLKTGNATLPALRHQDVNLFSDLLLHAMGPTLADDIVQGGAGPDEFRTAPLWGLGQRIFFLHDGRTTDLLEAIRAHRSESNQRFRASEANAVIDRFNALRGAEQQDMLNFLRSL